MKKYDLVIVSNRLPVNVTKEDGKLVYNVSSGGLATAMSSLESTTERIWIGWPGIAADDLTKNEKDAITKELAKYNCFPVFLTNDHVKNFYEGYSNDTLWPLFHYFQSYTQYNDCYWQSYQEVNELYLQAVEQVSSLRANIWIHDYHLLLLPALVRNILPESHIGFFLHIPFPSYEIFRLLPQRKEILQGLLGADLLGFHIYDYARHFASSCLRLLGVPNQYGTMHYEGRVIRIDAFPIGIDYVKFQETLTSDATKQEIATLKEAHPGQKIIISVDRLDYSKGIMERLQAFNLLLKQYPEYHKRVKLIVIAVPSRTEVETYKQLRENIERTVSRINGDYGTVDWAPISYQFQNLPFEKLIALYSMADVALVTPLRDGMNLVAKEYVATKADRSGVLILSEMTGAIDELTEAISINPNDIDSVAKAIIQALKMPKREQLERLHRMQERISSYTVQRWGNDFIEQLSLAGKVTDSSRKKRLTKSATDQLVASYKKADSRLLLLDYDGTLRNFTKSPSPSAAKPSPQLIATLKKITKKPNTTVCIVSGRSKQALESWFGKLPVALIAEHGAWVKHGKTWSQIDTPFAQAKKLIRPIMERYLGRTAGAIVEEKDYALVWHYRNVPTELAYVRTNDLRREIHTVIDNTQIGVHIGKQILEVKPKEVNKGAAVTEAVALYPADFILCAGDDYTDEDMFDRLPEDSCTIKVGAGETAARLQVPNVEKVLTTLEVLADAS